MLDINAFGRKMMMHSGTLSDDSLCNAFARVGDLLTRIGQPRAPKSIYDLSEEDLSVIQKALEIFNDVEVTA